MNISALFWVLWAIVGLVLEGIALWNGIPSDTLTGTVTTHVPGWAVYGVWGWLGWHFMVSYLNGKEER